LVAGSLQICGAWLGSTVPGGVENPKGFFEHIVLREKLVKLILSRIGCDPLGVRKLPPHNLQLKIKKLRDIVKIIIESDGYNNDTPWLYKDAKLTLLWPVFHDAFPDARWIIVRRKDDDIINSCLHTSFMRYHSSDPVYWEHFSNRYLEHLENLKKSGANVREIWSQDLIDGQLETFERVVNEFRLEYNESELIEFIDPVHWHAG